jgi:hypothetical protein
VSHGFRQWVSKGDIKTPVAEYKKSGSLARDNGTKALNNICKQKLFG